jgi:hypothetical protein
MAATTTASFTPHLPIAAPLNRAEEEAIQVLTESLPETKEPVIVDTIVDIPVLGVAGTKAGPEETAFLEKKFFEFIVENKDSSALCAKISGDMKSTIVPVRSGKGKRPRRVVIGVRYGCKNLRIDFFTEVKNGHKFVFVHVVGKNDSELIKLAKSKDGMGFPRGLCFVFRRMVSEDDDHLEHLQTIGFLDKFANDARESVAISVAELTEKAIKLVIAKKRSGSLGMMSAVIVDGQQYVVFCAKNSSMNIYSREHAEIMKEWYESATRRELFLQMIDDIVRNKWTISFEVCSPNTGHHGSLYHTRVAVALVIIAFDDPSCIRTILPLEETRGIMASYDLPHDSVYIIKDAETMKSFVERLSEFRDTITNDVFDGLVCCENIVTIKGNIDHSDLTNVLEGVIVWSYYENDEGRLCVLTIVCTKFKFGAYVVRTMLIRQAVVDKRRKACLVKPGQKIDCTAIDQAICRFLKAWIIHEHNWSYYRCLALYVFRSVSQMHPISSIGINQGYLTLVEPLIDEFSAKYALNGDAVTESLDQWHKSLQTSKEPKKIVIGFCGQPGIGKSTIIDEVAGRIMGMGLSVVVVERDSFGQGSRGHSAFISALRTTTRHADVVIIGNCYASQNIFKIIEDSVPFGGECIKHIVLSLIPGTFGTLQEAKTWTTTTIVPRVASRTIGDSNGSSLIVTDLLSSEDMASIVLKKLSQCWGITRANDLCRIPTEMDIAGTTVWVMEQIKPQLDARISRITEDDVDVEADVMFQPDFDHSNPGYSMFSIVDHQALLQKLNSMGVGVFSDQTVHLTHVTLGYKRFVKSEWQAFLDVVATHSDGGSTGASNGVVIRTKDLIQYRETMIVNKTSAEKTVWCITVDVGTVDDPTAFNHMIQSGFPHITYAVGGSGSPMDSISVIKQLDAHGTQLIDEDENKDIVVTPIEYTIDAVPQIKWF